MPALNGFHAAALVVLRFVLIAPAALGEDACQEGSQSSMKLLQVRAEDALNNTMAASPEIDGDKPQVLVQRKTKHAVVEDEASTLNVSSHKIEGELGGLRNLFPEAGTVFKIYMDYVVNGATKQCGLEWDSSFLRDMKYPDRHDPNAQVNERLAKWDCKSNADPVWIGFINPPDSALQIFAKVGSNYCGLEWSGKPRGAWYRAAKWDCARRADKVYFEASRDKTNEGKFYAEVHGTTCGLIWGTWWDHKARFNAHNELAAVWDCRDYVPKQDRAFTVRIERA